jgi:hypothetical protein
VTPNPGPQADALTARLDPITLGHKREGQQAWTTQPLRPRPVLAMRHFGRGAAHLEQSQIAELCSSCADGTLCVGPDGRVSPCIMSKKYPRSGLSDSIVTRHWQISPMVRDRRRSAAKSGQLSRYRVRTAQQFRLSAILRDLLPVRTRQAVQSVFTEYDVWSEHLQALLHVELTALDDLTQRVSPGLPALPGASQSSTWRCSGPATPASDRHFIGRRRHNNAP